MTSEAVTSVVFIQEMNYESPAIVMPNNMGFVQWLENCLLFSENRNLLHIANIIFRRFHAQTRDSGITINQLKGHFNSGIFLGSYFTERYLGSPNLTVNYAKYEVSFLIICCASGSL